MSTPRPTLTPQEAWQPLQGAAWDEEAARHLLRRIGFAATPDAVRAALKDGPGDTLRRLFASPPDFPAPASVAATANAGPGINRSLRRNASPEEQRRMQRELREKLRAAQIDLSIRWLEHASDPAHSAYEKWVLFLQDVLVVDSRKVRNPAFVHAHQDLLRRGALSRYPDLVKAVTRSPAMILYLDLQQSRKGQPNENFARELFELFTLGEGNYTETDVREAARAFTGYRQRAGRFVFVRNDHDTGAKTVFGSRGNHAGDDVVDLVFRQPAAETFLPSEMVRFYLSDVPLPPEYLAPLGSWWRRRDFSLSSLLAAFFGSRIFFDPAFRGNFIKSPIHYHLGLLQDLGLDLAPLPRRLLPLYQQMGQAIYNPPNVRGWVGGRHWINSTTLNARRALALALFDNLESANLNADEILELTAAETNGRHRFTVDNETVRRFTGSSPRETAANLAALLTTPPSDPQIEEIERFLRQPGNRGRVGIRAALSTLILLPEYQLA